MIFTHIMHAPPIRFAWVISVVALAAGCAGSAPDSRGTEAAATKAVDREVERVRVATARFKDLEEAVRAGYPREVSQCFDNPPEGGMGYHHVHEGLLDDRIEVERPEILVYERTVDGDYELVGVEYAVPLDGWMKEEPPTAMGQALKPAPGLGIWYLHVWVWRTNPKGLFADWNPDVGCHGG